MILDSTPEAALRYLAIAKQQTEIMCARTSQVWTEIERGPLDAWNGELKTVEKAFCVAIWSLQAEI
jgi:hypothetical protein